MATLSAPPGRCHRPVVVSNARLEAEKRSACQLLRRRRMSQRGFPRFDAFGVGAIILILGKGHLPYRRHNRLTT